MQAFATPVARCPYPEAAAVRDVLTEAVLSRLGEGKVFGYKQETSRDLTTWGVAELDALTGWVGRMTRQLVEKLAGVPLGEAFARSAGREGEGAGVRAAGIVASRSWASVYRAGDRHAAHFHPNTAWSAIYYLTAPGVCELDLLDPRPVGYFDAGIVFAGEDQRMRLSCSPGDLVIIPGWLRHEVPEFQDDEVRISLSWNLNYSLHRG
ncbi:hypothetical protein STTU_p0028 (plasmid) [Streptomyces sp. Tu6071]|nr:hypothetical protein STTU_p0028 [Streptomyces sp. Tu6071]